MVSFLETIDNTTGELRSLLSACEVETYGSDAATAMVVAASSLLKVAHAIETTFARRAETTNAWQGSGSSSSADFLASKTGESSHEMQRKLTTGRNMEKLPETEAAFKKGELAPGTAEQVPRAGAAAPERDGELAAVGASGSASAVKEKCERIANNARSVAERERRASATRAKRLARFWEDPDDDTAFKGFIRGPKADLARIRAVVDPIADANFRDARRNKAWESQDQYRYDALIEVLTTPPVDSGGSSVPPASGEEDTLFGDAFSASVLGPPVDPVAAAELELVKQRKSPRRYGGAKAQVIVNVDHSALIRGHTVGDERCEIAGVGTISVPEAWDILGDAIVRILVSKGQEVVSMATEDGRKITAATYAAAIARDSECANPLCHNTFGLELDHRRPVADHGPPVLSNLAMLCRHCHYLKTHKGFCLVGPRGSWAFVQRRPKGDGGKDYPLDGDEDPNDYLPSRLRPEDPDNSDTG